MPESNYRGIPTGVILKKLGGPTAVNRKLQALGYQTKLHTLRKWVWRRTVPAWAVPVLLDIAAKEGVELSHRDFIPDGEHPYEFLD
jgi:hypothetical protein